MNKIFLIGLLLVIIFGGAYFIWNKTAKPTSTTASSNQTVGTSTGSITTASTPATDSNASQNSQRISEKRISALSGWKTYTNNKLGFTFQYPATWVKDAKDAEVVNLSNVTTEMDINFTDTGSQTSLLIAYHFAPKGAELYRYAVSQYETKQGSYATGGKQIEVGGNKAIKVYSILEANGKGHVLDPKLGLTVVDFLDKKHTGEIQLQFKTPFHNQSFVIERLLSTFKFIP